jgi:hypothetical protein
VLPKGARMVSYLTPQIGAVVLIILQVMPLVALWLSLRWTTRHEETRARTLVAVAQSLPWGLQVEEQRADGSWLKVGWAAGSPGSGDGRR